MKRYLTFYLFLLTVTAIWGQNEAANWYFGSFAGLDFTTGNPVALNDGTLSTQEGCATISDSNGNLLFYTDGRTVRNQNHVLMPNGTGLLGDFSTTQSGLIVPHPGNSDLFYIFTVDDAGGPDGLQYSLVDMGLDGGLGDVFSKNTPLSNEVSEKLTAVTHANGDDIWLLSRSYPGNEFRAYSISAIGLDPVPVISTIGIDQPLDDSGNGGGSRGQMKISPDGQFLATGAVTIRNTELYRFDNNSGLVSNAVVLNSFFSGLPDARGGGPYGVEFSLDSGKLYIMYKVRFNSSSSESTIYQFDLSTYDQASIIASGIAITPAQSIEMGALQLAIDGKIYVAQYEQHYLGVINNPNLLGTAANYVENAVNLGAGQCRLGLPPFIQSYFIVSLQASNFCLGEATEFTLTTSEPILASIWDFGDGNGSTMETPSHTYAAPGDYTVSVTVTTASETRTETKFISIYPTPVANPAIDFEVCAIAPTQEFNLTTKNAEVLGGQSAIDNTVVYYASALDAQNDTNPLPDLYTNSSANETIYVRISNSENPSCFATTSFDLIVKQAAVLNTATDWIVCDTDTDGLYNFDLSQKDSEILNGQDTMVFAVSYYANQADADAGTNPIGPDYMNMASQEQLFYRIANRTYPECYVTGSFAVDVITGVDANMPAPIQMCDDDNDGFFTFDLTRNDAQILGGQAESSFSVSYHSTPLEADSGENALPANAYTNTIPYNETIYARVGNAANPDCYDTTPLVLEILDSPIVQDVSAWYYCDDDNDGSATFDLPQKDVEILGDQSATNFKISYYADPDDAEMAQNAVVAPYENTGNPQIIFYRLESFANAQCYLIGDFTLEVFNTPTANSPSPIIVCDINETGMQTFNLSGKDIEVLNGQDSDELEVLYYSNFNDAASDSNRLSKLAYVNSEANETLSVRVQNRQYEACYALTELEIRINPLPDPSLEETYVICPDSPELVLDGGNFESWSWRDSDGIELSNIRTLQITAFGGYTLTTSATRDGLRCDKTISFRVVSSGAPEDFNMTLSGFSDTISLQISTIGNGDFEYSVDGENFQDDASFGLFPGEYTVYVRDKFLCRTLSKKIFAVGYQKFFTPNGDNSNENWNIIGGENFPESQLFIFDRYGKLLSQIEPTSLGWDGRLNGRSLPETDYWFKYVFEEGKVFVGHFALKR